MGAVGSAALADSSVTTGKLVAGAVTAGDIANGSVSTEKLANGAVTGPKLADGSVTNAKLGPSAVTGAKIAGGTITAANIAPGQVVTAKGQLLSARLELGPTATGNTTLLALPGVATVAVDCTPTGANTTMTNTSGKAIASTVSGVDAGVEAFVDQTGVPLGGSDALARAERAASRRRPGSSVTEPAPPFTWPRSR